MTATLDRPAPAPAPGPRTPSRRDRPRWLLVMGIGLVVAVIAAVTLILESFSGAFTNYVAMRVEVPASSTAVGLNSPVEYRNVTVGKVTSQGTTMPNGFVSLDVHIEPDQVANIPGNITATVAPVSIFGNQFVVLVPPDDPGPATLHAGSVIPSEMTNQTASLQSTLADLDHLLIDLHPGELNAALTALAGALQGQGASIGQTLVKAHNYLSAMLPLWPTVIQDLQALVPVANQVAASAPDIAGIFRNGVAPADTVTAAGAQIAQLFANGATLSSQASALFATIRAPFTLLTEEAGPFFQDLSQTPDQISQTLSGLAAWATAWTSAENSGPYLKLSSTINVVNTADVGLALLGGPLASADLAAGLQPGMVNPAPYAGASLTAVHTAGVLPEPAAQDAVSSIVAGATGQVPASPAVASLLLGPVLSHIAGGA